MTIVKADRLLVMSRAVPGALLLGVLVATAVQDATGGDAFDTSLSTIVAWLLLLVMVALLARLLVRTPRLGIELHDEALVLVKGLRTRRIERIDLLGVTSRRAGVLGFEVLTLQTTGGAVVYELIGSRWGAGREHLADSVATIEAWRRERSAER